MPPARPLALNLVLAVVCTASAAVVAKGVLRATYRVPARTMPRGVVTRTTTAEYDVEIATNAEGFRDVEHPLVKPPGTTRIAVLGDSFVFGSGVAFDQIITSRMQALAPERGWDVEVLNFGVTGTGPVNMLRLWEQVVSRYRPDIVIIAVYAGNDASDALRESKEGRPRFVTLALARRGWARLHKPDAVPASVRPTPGGWNAFGLDNPASEDALLAAARARGVPEDSVRARLAAIPDSIIADARAFRTNPYNLAEAVLDPDALRNNVLLEGQRVNEGWAVLESTLHRLIAEIKRAGARPAVICIPAGVQVDRRYWWVTNLGVHLDQRVLDDAVFQRRLASVVKEDSLELNDLLWMKADRGEALYFRVDGHWTPRGHDLAVHANQY